MLNNYALNNPFFLNRYILIVELIKVINFVELIETIIKIIKLSYSLKLNVLTIWIREEILVICKRLYKSRKKCGYFYYLTNKYTIFHLFGLFLQRFMENLCTIHPRVISFHDQGRYGIKRHFQHLLAGRTC